MLARLFAARTISKPITVMVCASLLMSTLAPFGMASGGAAPFLRGRAQESGPSPRVGAPEGSLPNLDEIRNQQPPQPAAPPSVPSTMPPQAIGEESPVLESHSFQFEPDQ